MEIADLIKQSNVVCGLRASSKEQLLHELASRAAASLNRDQSAIFNALQSREKLGSTGIGEGIALPHARIEGLDRFFGIFARLSRPMDFESIDGVPVDLVFLLLIPAAEQEGHLAALAAISRQLRDKTIAAKLRKAADAAELSKILCAPQHP
ncbi:MAG TPA: PTS sugar transporter subunit IIA [Methylocella sp.]|nr:PTS sugar transporter subunit IIA [Methylocella sp.]